MLKPRALIAQVLPSDWATCRLAASRSASGRLVAPERRMSSPVITVIAAAACESGSLRRETEVTSISISSSMLRPFSSGVRAGRLFRARARRGTAAGQRQAEAKIRGA